ASHTYAAAGTNTVRISVTDKDGAAGSGQVTATVTATVNHPPVAGPAGPYSGSEGTAVAFDGGGSTDPDGDALTYSWSFGDGSSGTGVKPSHAYADNGTYGVTLTVTDARGAPSGPVTTTATIANAGPTVNAGVNQTATAGSAFALSTNFSDPGVKDAPWSFDRLGRRLARDHRQRHEPVQPHRRGAHVCRRGHERAARHGDRQGRRG